MTKKVLFVATIMGHFKAFHEPYMEWFKMQGWEVHAAAGEDAPLLFCDKKYGIPIQRSPFRVSNICSIIELKRIISEGNYDIIHCHTPMGGVAARLAAVLSKDKRACVIYTAHGFHFYKGAPLKNWLLYYPIERLLAHATDVLVTMNREDYARAKHFAAKRVEYVPGVGIDIERFHNRDLPAERQELRQEFGVSDQDIMLLSVGELIDRKNHAILLKAMAQLKNSQFKGSIRCVICGEGPLMEDLCQRAKDLGIEDRVVLAGRREDIPAICHAADIFVFPSRQEGLPIALLEAMASGLPVVASHIRGNCDLVKHKKNGYLVPAESVPGYVAAIEKLILSKKRRAVYGTAAAKTARHYSIQHALAVMSHIYNSEMAITE